MYRLRFYALILQLSQDMAYEDGSISLPSGTAVKGYNSNYFNLLYRILLGSALHLNLDSIWIGISI